MSVINFSLSEIDDIQASVKNFYRHGSRKTYLKYTSAVRKASEFNFNNKDFEAIISETIERCFWYIFVSNQICYSLQYRENPVLFDDANNNYEFKSSGNLSPSELLKRLKSLNYNIVTNDGNKFIEPVYYEFFEKIIHDIEQDLLEPILYPKTKPAFNVD